MFWNVSSKCCSYFDLFLLLTSLNFESPMNQDVCWGSRPVPDRYWGCSEMCDDEVIARLTQAFEEREVECEFSNCQLRFYVQPKLLTCFPFLQQRTAIQPHQVCQRHDPPILHLI